MDLLRLIVGQDELLLSLETVMDAMEKLSGIQSKLGTLLLGHPYFSVTPTSRSPHRASNLNHYIIQRVFSQPIL
jgi:hypothetical protein